jgi:hypothetical protein
MGKYGKVGQKKLEQIQVPLVTIISLHQKIITNTKRSVVVLIIKDIDFLQIGNISAQNASKDYFLKKRLTNLKN